MANIPAQRTGSNDTLVSTKKLPAQVGVGSTIFEILLWVPFVIPGVIFLFMKIAAKNRFQQLEQKLQHDASQVDNYLEQRVVVLQNCARLVERAVELDKSTYESLAKYRSGAALSEEARSTLMSQLDDASYNIRAAVESYPELRAHQQIETAMQQNLYLQREITAARELYNDTVNTWNKDIFAWPTRMIVAARNGYTTKIPFTTSTEIRNRANDVLF